MEKQMRKLNKVTAAVAGGALVVATAGVAYAYWTTNGTGTGSAAAGQDVAWDVTTTNTSAAADALTPGGPTQTVNFKVENDGTGVQRLQAVAVKVALADGTAWSVGSCNKDDFTVGAPTFTAGDIAPGANKTGTVTIQMLNNNENQDDCQGVNVPLHVAAS